MFQRITKSLDMQHLNVTQLFVCTVMAQSYYYEVLTGFRCPFCLHDTFALFSLCVELSFRSSGDEKGLVGG